MTPIEGVDTLLYSAVIDDLAELNTNNPEAFASINSSVLLL